MSENGALVVKFWGVRGSIACPGPTTLRYGGNTSCVEVCCGDHVLIFDAGTGLRSLGEELDRRGVRQADLFLSHTHLDHIVGLPFFSPIFNPENSIHIRAGHLLPANTVMGVLCQMMQDPLFPVPPEVFQAKVCYEDFECGATIEPRPGVVVRTTALNHPNNATGYRVEHAGHSVCYITDTEHVEGERDASILGLIEGADLFIYDTTYTDDEYPRYRGYGHSTWQEGVRLAEAAGVGRLVLFHHDPSHDDDFMDRIAAAAEAMRPGTLVAREGMTIEP